MKVIVYVDGFNLYYGALKHSPYKWLDIHKFFSQNALKSQIPKISRLTVKFYTADIKSNFSRLGAKSSAAQQAYHRALESPHTGDVEVIKGFYNASRATPMVYNKPPQKDHVTEVWKLEEKQTDVNIALDLYRDASKGDHDFSVLCSSDTDVVPAFKYIKKDFPSLGLGVVLPLLHKGFRKLSAYDKYSDWVIRSLTEKDLELSQFKNRVPTRKKPVDKPDHW